MVLKRSLMLLLPAFFALSQAHAAGPTSPIIFNDRDAITVTMVPPPNVGGGGGGGGSNPDQWLRVEFHYSVVPRTTTPYVDSAEFKIWIEGRDMYAADAPGAAGVAVALTGGVTYVNIPASRDSYGVLYLHPSTLARYSTKEGIEDFERKFNIHMEVSAGGTLSDYIDKNQKDPGGPDWYKALKPVANLVYRQDQSPFLLADVDRYPAIKQATPAAQ
jgi:hypothetical protein